MTGTIPKNSDPRPADPATMNEEAESTQCERGLEDNGDKSSINATKSPKKKSSGSASEKDFNSARQCCDPSKENKLLAFSPLPQRTALNSRSVLFDQVTFSSMHNIDLRPSSNVQLKERYNLDPTPRVLQNPLEQAYQTLYKEHNQSSEDVPKDFESNSGISSPVIVNKLKSVIQILAGNSPGSHNTMMNETDRSDGIFNSTSLEDVALSETNSIPRAQSVTSIDSTQRRMSPTEINKLEARLMVSRRNMEDMKEKQRELKQLQQNATSLLEEIENSRLSNQNSEGIPDFQSVEHMQSHMDNLLRRMKQLKTFVQRQVEFSASLGEDGSDLVTEQTEILKQWEGIFENREQMANMVSDLNEASSVIISNGTSLSNVEEDYMKADGVDEARNVPIDFESDVPVELVRSQRSDNSHENCIENPVEEAIIHKIEKKLADINTMKNKLEELKDMMGTGKFVSKRVLSKCLEDICCKPNESSTENSLHHSLLTTTNIKNTDKNYLVSNPLLSQEKEKLNREDEAQSEKVRMLSQVTESLRNQSLHLSDDGNHTEGIDKKCDHLEKQNDGVILNGGILSQGKHEDAINSVYENIVTQSPSVILPSNLFRKISAMENNSVDSRASDLDCPALFGSVNSESQRNFSFPSALPIRDSLNQQNGFQPVSSEAPTNFSDENNTNAPFTPAANYNIGSVPNDCACHYVASHSTVPQNQLESAILSQFLQTQNLIIAAINQSNQLITNQQRDINVIRDEITAVHRTLFAIQQREPTSNNRQTDSIPLNCVQNNFGTRSNRAQSEQPYTLLYANKRNPDVTNINGPSQTPLSRRQTNVGDSYRPPATISQRCPNIVVQPEQFGCSPQWPAFRHTNTVMHHPYNNVNYFNQMRQHLQNNPQNCTRTSQAVNDQANSALNNQVPPGNRANNYWDNFRSYSRQNQLSSGSHKNEENQQVVGQQQSREPQSQNSSDVDHGHVSSTNNNFHVHPATHLPNNFRRVNRIESLNCYKNLINNGTTNVLRFINGDFSSAYEFRIGDHFESTRMANITDPSQQSVNPCFPQLPETHNNTNINLAQNEQNINRPKSTCNTIGSRTQSLATEPLQWFNRHKHRQDSSSVENRSYNDRRNRGNRNRHDVEDEEDDEDDEDEDDDDDVENEGEDDDEDNDDDDDDQNGATGLNSNRKIRNSLMILNKIHKSDKSNSNRNEPADQNNRQRNDSQSANTNQHYSPQIPFTKIRDPMTGRCIPYSNVFKGQVPEEVAHLDAYGILPPKKIHNKSDGWVLSSEVPNLFLQQLELMHFIICRVRTEIFDEPITDEMRTRIAEITASIMHNVSFQHYHLRVQLTSANGILADMQRLGTPDTCERFLDWYTDYLEQLFTFGMSPDDYFNRDCEYEASHLQRSSSSESIQTPLRNCNKHQRTICCPDVAEESQECSDVSLHSAVQSDLERGGCMTDNGIMEYLPESEESDLNSQPHTDIILFRENETESREGTEEDANTNNRHIADRSMNNNVSHYDTMQSRRNLWES